MNASEIAEHPFLHGMKPEHLTALAQFAMATQFEAGQFIFREGDTANCFYLILRGRVELGSTDEPGRQVLAQTIAGGEVLGWSWLVPPYQWQFDARAVEDTEAIFFYGTVLRARCEDDHELGYELMQRVAVVIMQRLQAARAQLLNRQSGAQPPTA